MSKKYELFEVDDFVTDDFFVQWVQERDEASEAFWHRWQLEHPEQQHVIEEATALVQLFQHASNVDVMDGYYDSLKERIDETIYHHQQVNRVDKEIKKARFNWSLPKIAAALLIVFLSAATAYFLFRPTGLIIHGTQYGEIKKVILPDGSEVILNANSTISYMDGWNNDKRSVEMNGEVLFNIKHIGEGGNRVPFEVIHQDAKIEVLGTVFAVKSRDSSIRLALQEGSVRFSVHNETEGKELRELLSPGDVLHYKGGQVEKRNTDIDRYMAWTRQELHFDNTPLKEACAQLEEYFGTAFIIQDPALEKEPLNGTLRVKSEKELLLTLSVLLKVPVTKYSEGVIIGQKE